MRFKLVLLFIIALLILAKFTYDQMKPPFEVGEKVPDFALTTLAGPTVRLRDFEGRFVLIHFWATWCSACRSEMEGLEGFAAAFPDISVLAVSEDEGGADSISGFFGGRLPGYSILLDSGQLVADKYKSYKIPETYIVDNNGLFVKRFQGPVSWGEQKVREYFSSLIAKIRQ